MAEKNFNLTSVGFQLSSQAQPIASEIDESSPFHIAVLGDFSGRANRGIVEPGRIGTLKSLVVDRDNFDEILGRLKPELELPVGGPNGPKVKLSFSELDDFHPDRIFEQLEVFSGLRDTRRKLLQASTFAAAAAEVQSWAKVTPKAAPAPAPAPEQPADTPVIGEGADLLASMLSAAEEAPPVTQQNRAASTLQQLIQEAVSPYVVPKADPRQDELVACVDEATSAQMRSIIHHPEFQALEAAWRALFFLIRRLDTDSTLKVFLLDISKPELAKDLLGQEDASKTGTWKLLVERTVGTPGAIPWGVLVGNYTFELTAPDAVLASRIGAIAAQAGAPLLAAADDALVGTKSLAATPDPDNWQPVDNAAGEEAWELVSQLPEAKSIGLVVPRFLLRTPYSDSTYATEKFDFEELPDGAGRHQAFLWGNGAFAAAYLLGENFSRDGWGFEPHRSRDISGIPLFVGPVDGEPEMTPCGEALLSERALERLVERRVMPLITVKGTDTIRIGRFQSLAQPEGTPLAGRWG